MKRTLSGLMAFTVLVSGVSVHARFDVKPQSNGKVSLQVCDSAIRKGVTYEITSNKSSMKATLIGQEDMGCTETINVTSTFAPANATLTIRRLNGDFDIDTAVVPGGNNGGGTTRPPTQPDQPGVLDMTVTQTKNLDGSITVKACNIDQGKPVAFQLEEKDSEDEYRPQTKTADRNGCAEYTYSSDIVNRGGMSVRVSVNGIGPIQQLGSGSSSGGNTRPPAQPPGVPPVQPPVMPPTPTTQPAPVLKTVSQYEIKRNAIEAADYFIAQVVNYYGVVEMVRTQVREGFLRGEKYFNLLNGNYASLPSFAKGKKDGTQTGRTQGFDDGASRGNSEGSSSGQSNALERFVRVVDTGTAPNLEYTAVTPSYHGSNPNLSTPASPRDQLKKKENEIARLAEQQLRSRSVGIVIDGQFVELFKVDSLWSPSFKDDLKNNWWGNPSQTAYEYWRDRTDARLNQSKTSQHRFREEIVSSEYATPDANGRLFREEFRNRFDQQFAAQWTLVANQYNQQLQDAGNDMYLEALTKYAYDLGYNEGYTEKYRQATIEGFNETYSGARAAAYNRLVQAYTTRPQISQVLANFENASLKSAQRPRSDAPGDSIRLIVSGATNLATVSASLDVSVLNSNRGTYDVRASSKAKERKVFENVATLPNNFPFNGQFNAQNINVSGNVGSFSQSANYTVTLRGYLQKLSQMPQGQEKSNYGAMMINALRNEWPKASDGDDYDNKSGTLLHQIVAAATQLSGQDRAAIKALVPLIKLAYPSERPGFFSGIRDDWDAAMALINQI